MIGIPPLGARVKVWPTPGRLVQLDNRPVDRWAGGRWMPASGVELEWTTFAQEQLCAGDLMFHAPPAAEPKSLAKPAGLFDPHAAAAEHHAREAKAVAKPAKAEKGKE